MEQQEDGDDSAVPEPGHVPTVSPNAHMIGLTPFVKTTDSESPRSVQQQPSPFNNGTNDIRIRIATPRTSTTSSGSRPEPGTIDLSPSYSERVKSLRPEGCRGVSTPYLPTGENDTGQFPYREMPGRVGPQPRRYSSDLLNYDHTPAYDAAGLAKGPLSSEEKVFYMNFEGNWIMDKSRSDSVDNFLAMIQLSQKQNEPSRSDTLSFKIDDHNIALTMNARGIGTITETRPWTGGKIPNDRRDHRPGGAESWIERYPQGIILRTRWSGAFALDIYEYCETTSDFMHLVTRQDIFMSSTQRLQRRVIWDRQLS